MTACGMKELYIAGTSSEVWLGAVWRGNGLWHGPCVPCRSAATSFGVLMFLAEFEEVNDVWFF